MDAAGERRGCCQPRGGVRAARERRVGRRRALPRRALRAARAGTELVGLRYRGPFDDLAPGAIGRAPCRRRGTRSRSTRAPASSTSRPAAAARTSSSARSLGLPCPRRRSTRPGHFYDDYGWLHGLSTVEAADQIVGQLGETRLPRRGGDVYEHRYPHCWRCDTPLIWRISDDWFIGVDGCATSCSRRTRPSSGCRRTWASAWTTGCATWATGTSRAAATTGCRCRSTAARCGHLNVIGSKDGAARARDRGLRPARGAAPPVDRPRADRVRAVRRTASSASIEVGDVWLDAGIVPFSTLGWQNPEWVEGGYATGASRGLIERDLPDHALLGEVVPGRLGLGNARADPALVLLAALHVGRRSSVARRSSACSATRRCSTSTGREMHGSWGNMISAEDAFARMGADVMRWQYCAQPPDRDLLLRLRPRARDQAQAAHALELDRVPRPVREHRGLRADACRPRRGPARGAAARPLARRADARVRARGDRRLRGDADGGRDPRLRGVRRRPLQLVHPPLAPALLRRRRRRVPDALVRARAVAARGRAGDAVPGRAPLGGTSCGAGRLRSSSPAGPQVPDPTTGCSPRSPRCAASSSSGARRARRRG